MEPLDSFAVAYSSEAVVVVVVVAVTSCSSADLAAFPFVVVVAACSFVVGFALTFD